jgi:hypothetical protein
MSIVERDEARSQLQGRDDLCDPRLRAETDDGICVIDDPTTDSAAAWLQSDLFLCREVIR